MSIGNVKSKIPQFGEGAPVAVTRFLQEEDGVLITVDSKPLILLKDCALVYDHNTGLTIRNGETIVGAMSFGEGGDWLYRITGVELVPAETRNKF